MTSRTLTSRPLLFLRQTSRGPAERYLHIGIGLLAVHILSIHITLYLTEPDHTFMPPSLRIMFLFVRFSFCLVPSVFIKRFTLL